jgi:hypothetical protein
MYELKTITVVGRPAAGAGAVAATAHAAEKKEGFLESERNHRNAQGDFEATVGVNAAQALTHEPP